MIMYEVRRLQKGNIISITPTSISTTKQSILIQCGIICILEIPKDSISKDNLGKLYRFRNRRVKIENDNGNYIVKVS